MSSSSLVPSYQTGEIRRFLNGKKSIFTTPNPFEQQFGYHRAVRRGPFIFVSGTTAIRETPESSSSATIDESSHSEPSTETAPPSYESITTSKTDPSVATTASGTTSEKDAESTSKVHFPKDARKQAQVAMARCIEAVKHLGGTLEDVVRVKMFVSRHEDCAAIGAAFRDCFTDPGPSLISTLSTQTYTNMYKASEVGATATMIVVEGGFVDPDVLIEVEVDAVVMEGSGRMG